MPTIIPQRVKIVREARNKSQVGLLKSSKYVSKRTLQRIESCKADYYEIREDTLIDLAGKLRVDRKVLTGELSLPDEITNPQQREVKLVRSTSAEDIETYETRLVRIDDGYIVVEFTKSDPTGRIIARGIPDEDAGQRLTSNHTMRELLAKAHQTLREIYSGEVEDQFETDDEYMSFLDAIALQLSSTKTQSHNLEIKNETSVTFDKSESSIGDTLND